MAELGGAKPDQPASPWRTLGTLSVWLKVEREKRIRQRDMKRDGKHMWKTDIYADKREREKQNAKESTTTN
eukprot:1989276-Pyramimonas_sp.AAC.3